MFLQPTKIPTNKTALQFNNTKIFGSIQFNDLRKHKPGSSLLTSIKTIIFVDITFSVF